jgi:hypothetical protein
MFRIVTTEISQNQRNLLPKDGNSVSLVHKCDRLWENPAKVARQNSEKKRKGIPVSKKNKKITPNLKKKKFPYFVICTSILWI